MELLEKQPYKTMQPLKWSSNDALMERPCLLMFSGGRDSSLAAIRLHQAGTPLCLVTVTSNHLFGVERVKKRIEELAKVLPPETQWLHIRQPTDLRTDVSFYQQTCLPCHHAYVVISGILAKAAGVDRLGFGYAGYQSGWPEQTPLAVSRLKEVLARHGITLELPTYDINSRDDALQELEKYSLSPESLEQKCSRQVTNVTLDIASLQQQVALWEGAIHTSMQRLDEIEIEILDSFQIGDLM